MQAGLCFLYSIEVGRGVRGLRVHVARSHPPHHAVPEPPEGIADTTAWALERRGLTRVEAGLVSLTNEGRVVAAALMAGHGEPGQNRMADQDPLRRGHLRLASSVPDQTDLDADVSARQRQRRRRVMAARRQRTNSGSLGTFRY